MKGMTLDFAVTRIFELESKQDMPLNRKMIHSYLESLRKGLEKNKLDYLSQNNLTEEQLRLQYASKRFVEGAGQGELRQFQVKGYEAMLNRILEVPLKASEENNNKELSDKLMVIKNQLEKQTEPSFQPIKQKQIESMSYFE
jgi:hypothetical protein